MRDESERLHLEGLDEATERERWEEAMSEYVCGCGAEAPCPRHSGVTTIPVTTTERIADVLSEHRHLLPWSGHDGYYPNACTCGETLDRPGMAGDWDDAMRIHRLHLAAVIAALFDAGERGEP